MNTPLVAAGTCAAATVGTWLVRRYALSRNVLDLPNERSSHVRPTPRGGGAAIVVAFLSAILYAWQHQALTMPVALATLGAGVAIAGIGFLDDHRPIPARLRLVVHFGAVALVLALLDVPAVWRDGLTAALPVLLWYPVAAFGLVWLLNLYNFMDGIDGLAAAEAVFTCGAAVLLAFTTGRGDATMAVLLGAASLGFLFWNAPPASIFMGDVGSGFLGMLLGVVGLTQFAGSWRDVTTWLILLAVFVTDATITLVRRWRQGIPVATAHRTHAYQHAAQRFGGHRPVTVTATVINVGWLLPIALLVAHGRLAPLLGLAIAYLPLGVLTWRLGAGVARPTP